MDPWLLYGILDRCIDVESGYYLTGKKGGHKRGVVPPHPSLEKCKKCQTPIGRIKHTSQEEQKQKKNKKQNTKHKTNKKKTNFNPVWTFGDNKAKKRIKENVSFDELIIDQIG